MEADTTPIGAKLEYWRKRRVLSIRQLSDLTGVSRMAISQIENGVRQARRDTVLKLIAPQGLNISLDELMNTVLLRPAAAA